MNNDTAEAMVGFLYTIPGLAVLIWALYAGILRRAPDQVMYYVIEDGQDVEETQCAPARISPKRTRFFLAMIAVIFTVVAVSTIATVVVASGPAHPTTAGKCPFF